jgi:hypothetical protein
MIVVVDWVAVIVQGTVAVFECGEFGCNGMLSSQVSDSLPSVDDCLLNT